jgi:carboxymethylenebutenolidase
MLAGKATLPRAKETAAMTQTRPQPSPEGVPGAVTDTSAILAEQLTFAGAGGEPVNGYLARPVDASRLPAMVVIHEAGGLGDHIKDVVNRFANIGYLTLGVDLYTREGGPPPTDDPQALMARLFAMSDATALGDLEGAADYLRSRSQAGGRVGCIGFCMGGRYTLLFATAGDRLDAAVDCWGGFIDRATLEERSTPQRPTPPLELAERLTCPLMAAIGAEDQNPSPALGERLREAALRSGQEVSVEVYEGAGHAFFADYRPSYRPGPAARLWENVVPFLERHLKDA